MVRREEEGLHCLLTTNGVMAVIFQGRNFLSQDTELLAVSLCPYYLPRKFTYAIIIVVYIKRSADSNVACDVISSVTDPLHTNNIKTFS